MRLSELLKQTEYQIVAFAVSFFLIITLFPGQAAEFQGAATVAASLFGIYIGFSINSSRIKLNRVNELLKTENANNLLIYRLSANFGNEVQNKIRKLLDAYIIDQIDYKLEDFDQSGKTFYAVYRYVVNLNATTAKEKTALSSMISVLNTQSTNRAQIETLTLEHLSKLEWLSLGGLTIGFIISLWPISTGNILLSFMLTILATAVILLVFVLRDLDRLKWQKSTWTWRPLHKLFNDLDLVPYYPLGVILRHEAKVQKGEKIRIARYFNHYPNMEDKTIETVEYGNDKL